MLSIGDLEEEFSALKIHTTLAGFLLEAVTEEEVVVLCGKQGHFDWAADL